MDQVLDVLVNELTRDCVFEAAYEAERTAFNRGRCRRCSSQSGCTSGPRERVLELARPNLSFGIPTDSVSDQARAAAVSVLSEAHNQRKSRMKGVVSGQAAVKKTRVYSGEDLLV